MYIDLAAERLLAAERGTDRIAVEVKSFVGESDIRDLEVAIGQFVFYRFLMAVTDPERQLLLAVIEVVYDTVLQEPIARPVVEGLPLKLLAFNPHTEVVVRWIR